MLASLLNVPKSQEDWDRWSWAHKTSHERIRQAIQQQKGNNLTEYQLDPINFNAVRDFLIHNQQTHNEMNGVLGLQGSDLEGVKIEDPNQLRAWVWNHYLEHQSAELALGV